MLIIIWLEIGVASSKVMAAATAFHFEEDMMICTLVDVASLRTKLKVDRRSNV